MTTLVRAALLVALTGGCTVYLEPQPVCIRPERRASGESALKIAGGVESDGDRAVVGVLRTGGDIFCTGTLVGERVVLTAAHCVRDESPTSLAIVIGESSGSGVHVGVLATAIHPEYIPEPVFDNDVAMLLLERPVAPEVAEPARLATCIDAPLDEVDLRLVGFGKRHVDDDGPARKRQGEALVTWSDDDTFTTGSAPAQACIGDSGGPAFVRFSGRDYLVGVVSHGDPDCDRYAAYTRVDAFYDTFIVYYLDPPKTPSPPPSPLEPSS